MQLFDCKYICSHMTAQVFRVFFTKISKAASPARIAMTIVSQRLLRTAYFQRGCKKFGYRTEVPWWAFVATTVVALTLHCLLQVIRL
jgi:hypothetical protein